MKSVPYLLAALFVALVWLNRYDTVGAGLNLYRVDRFTGSVSEEKDGRWLSAEDAEKVTYSGVAQA